MFANNSIHGIANNKANILANNAINEIADNIANNKAFHFVDFWDQCHKVIKSRLLGMVVVDFWSQGQKAVRYVCVMYAPW